MKVSPPPQQLSVDSRRTWIRVQLSASISLRACEVWRSIPGFGVPVVRQACHPLIQRPAASSQRRRVIHVELNASSSGSVQARWTAPAQTHTWCWWGGAPNLTRTALLVQAIAWAATSSSTPSSQRLQALTLCPTAGVHTVSWPSCSGCKLRGWRNARRGRSSPPQGIELAFEQRPLEGAGFYL